MRGCARTSGPRTPWQRGFGSATVHPTAGGYARSTGNTTRRLTARDTSCDECPAVDASRHHGSAGNTARRNASGNRDRCKEKAEEKAPLCALRVLGVSLLSALAVLLLAPALLVAVPSAPLSPLPAPPALPLPPIVPLVASASRSDEATNL